MIAHAAWFVEGRFPSDWGFVTAWLTLTYAAIGVLAAVVVRAVGTRRPGRGDVRWLSRLVPWMPFCVRIHIAVALIMLASFGRYLTPAMHLERTPAGYLLGTLELVVALLFAVGWHTRAAALLLVASGPIGFAEFGYKPLLGVHLLGGALFVLFTGAGRWSADWELGARHDFSYLSGGRGLWCYRAATGCALLFAAFDEKLARPEISLAFLERYPRFNLLADVGIPIGSLEYTRLAGGMEILLALLLISGAMPKVIAPIAAFPFVATLTALGTFELGGHQPAHAAVIAFIVFAASPQLRPAVYELWPWRRALEDRPLAHAAAPA